MKVLHLKTKRKLESWTVQKYSQQPAWAEKFFAEGSFKWNGEKSLAIKNAGGLLKMTVPVGDIMVFNGKYLKAVPAQKFTREYKILD
ncbi:hypothetical protein OZX60_01250 [Streptococcaceae bacterium ESL0687]|nr:hypothetical protein OZX60_01250 [Streptococcaceae bacterium ESL0687]